MTTTAPRTECSTCSAPRRGGALFCVRCGSPFEEASVRVPMPRVQGTSTTADDDLDDLDDPSPTSTEGFPLPPSTPRPTPTGGFPAPHPSPVRGVPVPQSTGGVPVQRATGGFPVQQGFPAPHPSPVRGVPVQRPTGAFPAPHTGPYAYAPPPAEPRRSRRDLVIVGVSLAVILLAGLAIVAVQPGIRARFLGGVEAAPSVTAPSQAAPVAPIAPAEPNAQLGAQAAGDRPRAEATVGSWVPQLSAKKVGLVADGRTYDDAAIWADHQQLRARYPDALLVWSSDYTSFKGSDFWITVVDRPFSSAAQANAWCDSAGLDGDSCYAKRLSHTGDSGDHTRQR